MYYQEMGGGYLVRLYRGEEIRAGLSELMERQEIGAGFVVGLGAVTNPDLGYYVLDEKRYVERQFEGEFELASLTGSLSWHDGEPFPHIHVMLTGAEFHSFGGHCFEATTSATVEMWVAADRQRVTRALDDAIGLHLMQLSESCPIGPRGDG